MRKELELLQKLMQKQNISTYIVPTNDFHGSEYINEYFKSREYISGFTGSAGTLVVNQDSAYLWTDGRYFLQAAKQLENSGITLMKSGEAGVPEIDAFLLQNLKKGDVLALDGRMLSCRQGQTYKAVADKCGADTQFDLDLPSQIWEGRPSLSGNPVWRLSKESSGMDFGKKIAKVRDAMFEKAADYHLITGLEENAWLYNLRGSDVKRTPVFFSFTLISPDSVTVYKFRDESDEYLQQNGVTVKDYLSIFDDIKKIPITAGVLVDFDTASYSLVKSLPPSCKVIDSISPVSLLKAVKNEIEIAATKKAHIGDGLAMVNFIYWLKKTIGTEELSEMSISDYLESQRKKQEGFLDLSFDTIAGYMANGAIVHYSATPESNATLEAEGFILVDSGGQYLNGTTDITRTIALGPLSDKMKRYYTAVLRGHLDLAMARFSEGTTGSSLDSLARGPLNEIGLDYNHGTGHGVGHVLSVHEGPQSISKKPNSYELKPGMITSDEPGVYIENEFGIRIENEILCKKCENDDELLCFEMLTLCPYEPEAIIPEMLSDSERKYLNSYNKKVYEILSPMLDEDVRIWLKTQTKSI
ncbi:MAG: aminopeptidase P family protein [Eubacterium sp.]|nr:aminopeptidase P family protein [Eubacterium sp.]